MKKYFWLLACLIASVTFVACGDDDDAVNPDTPDTPDVPVVHKTTMYFINEGSYSVANSASVGQYNPETKKVSLWQEATAKLGDTPQDMLLVGNMLYITCWGSNGMLVADVTRASEPRFVSFGDCQPRYMAYKAPYLYVSCYGGVVIRYNTTSGSTRKLQTSGANLEGAAIVGDKLYVCNSHSVDGEGTYTYLNTLITVDLKTFTEKSPIETVVNPNYLMALDGKLYVLGFGNYYDKGYMLAKVNVNAGTSTDITPASKMCAYDGKVFFCYGETDWTTYTTTTSFGVYDPATGQVTMDSKTSSETVYMLKEDPYSHELYSSVTDYVNTGAIYRFNTKKEQVDKFSSEGINPSCAVFYRN